MKAMIMAAGVGSRLMPLTTDIPKPMIPVANRPLMESTVMLLRRYGFTQLIANLHYHSQIISNYFGDGRTFELNLRYSPEEELRGTAGGVKKCEWFLDESFLVISGDALTDINLTRLFEQHKKNGALATIALKEIQKVEQFGVVVTDEYGKIRQFQEKPPQQLALSNLANTGIYIFEPEIFKYIPPNRFYDFGKQVFPHLVKIDAPFFGVPIEDYWCDVGDLDTYRQAHADILQGRLAYHALDIISRTGTADRVLLGENVKIAQGVNLMGNVIIGANCRIETGAFIRDAVVWNDTVIESGAVLNECIIGSDCRIGTSAVIGSGAVIASGCKLQANDRISPKQKIFKLMNEESKQLQQG